MQPEHSGPSSALALFKLTPPYTRFEEMPGLDASEMPDLPLGSVLVIELGDHAAWPAIAQAAPRLRARFPAAPLALRIRNGVGIDPAEAARLAAPHHIRAVLGEDAPPRETLQPVLTDPASLTQELEDWLAARGVDPPPPLRSLIVDIFRQAPEYPRLHGLLQALGRPERTVRNWFQRAGLPGPGAWLAAAHAVYAALRLQRERQTSLLTIAVECGYSDHSSLSRQAVRLFGARPGEIRQTLGWEGLLDRWLGRAGVGVGAASA
jgi:AraC-like DNA-binding protein